MWVIDTCIVLDVFENDSTFGRPSAEMLQKLLTTDYTDDTDGGKYLFWPVKLIRLIRSSRQREGVRILPAVQNAHNFNYAGRLINLIEDEVIAVRKLA